MEKRKKIIHSIIEWVKSFIFAIVVIFIMGIFFRTTSVINISMKPALKENDNLILYRLGEVKRGDIVSFKSDIKIRKNDIDMLNFIQKMFVKEGQPMLLIKRVIGLPGEKILIKDGNIYVNGKILEEDYINIKTNGELYIEEIPKNKYLLLGDNRMASLDSRNSSIGLVDKEKIVGKAIFRYWPLNRINIIRRPY